jgi:hypothetical protein
MFSDAEPTWRYLLLAGLLGAAILLTVIAEHIEHSGWHQPATIAQPVKAAARTEQ